jgi:acetolactate synthase regulatory subunit
MPHLEAVNTLPTRADVWSAGNVHCSVRYQLQAEAEPDLLCRVLNLFALQFLTPEQVNAQRQDDSLSLEIVIDGLSWHRAQVIAQKLRNLISVYSVDLQSADAAWVEAAKAAG